MSQTSKMSEKTRTSHLLSQVTKKGNEISAKLSDYSPENILFVKGNLQDYHERVAAWETAHNDYLEKVSETIDRERMESRHRHAKLDIEMLIARTRDYLYEAGRRDPDVSLEELGAAQEEVQPKDSVSSTSSNSKQSSLLSAKIKIAEEKAKLEAEMTIQEEEENVREMMRRAIAAQEIMKRKKKMLELENIERKLERLSTESQRELKPVTVYRPQPSHMVEERTQVGLPKPNSTDRRNPMNQVSENEWSNTTWDPRKHVWSNEHELRPTTSEAQSLLSHPETFKQKVAEEVVSSMAHLQAKASLPTGEPDIFDGKDMVKYLEFKEAFEFLIAKKCDNDQERYYYLRRFTKDNPKTLIESCKGRSPEESYRRAWEVLDRNYGNKTVLIQTLLRKLENWPCIKNEDPKALKELSVYLQRCQGLKREETKYSVLDNPAEIRKVVDKLPYRMKMGWRKEVYRREKNDQDSYFDDLVEFVCEAAAEINHPLYGNLTSAERDKKIPPGAHGTKKAFKASASRWEEEEQREKGKNLYCYLCKRTSHSLDECTVFKRKTHDQRVNLIKEQRLCFGCLIKGHSSRNCRNRIVCKECSRRHPTCLHSERNKEEASRKREGSKNKDQNTQENESQKADQNIETSSEVQTQSKTFFNERKSGWEKVLGPAIPVRISLPGGDAEVETYAAMDTFSTDTYISPSILNALKAWDKTRVMRISITTIVGNDRGIKVETLRKLNISDIHGNYVDTLENVYCTKQWPFTMVDSPSKQDVEGETHLNDIPFHFLGKPIGILIGMRQSKLMIPLEVVYSENKKTFAVRYSLGWSLAGTIYTPDLLQQRRHCHLLRVDEQLNQLYNDEFRCEGSEDLLPSKEERRWEQITAESINKLPTGQHEVALPFASDEICLPFNRRQVAGRLESTKKKLKKDDALFQEYKTFMEMMLKKEYAEKVPSEELEGEKGKKWYLTHFGVHHKTKGTLRIVFDCSLKFQGISLNDVLLQGPDLTNNLLGVLLRFRQGMVAFTADIKKMFYQIKVPHSQRDYLRFLWFPNSDLNKEVEEYRVTVHIFGATSSPACANYVLKAIAKTPEAQECKAETRRTIENNFYVDDVLKSLDSMDHARTVLGEITRLLADNGFELTGFVSNSEELMESIPEESRSQGTRNIGTTKESEIERALGVVWDTREDKLGINLKLPDQSPTKRGVLSTVFSLYDPFGFVAPAILPAKRIFQKSCNEGIGWDDQLPTELLKSWDSWKQEVPLLTEFTIPRCLKDKPNTENELHIFCDGSEVAYAAVAYLRTQDESREVTTRLIMSKSHLVPLKKTSTTTVPRIELNGARLGVKVNRILSKELDIPISRTTFWTDSTAVLKYLNNTSKPYQRFVANRVAYVLDHTEVSQWRYVDGKQNPADLGSRGSSPSKFLQSSEWKEGPIFLKEDEAHWPAHYRDLEVEEGDTEVKRVKSILTTLASIEKPSPTQILLESGSSWHKVSLKVAWFLRFGEYLRTKQIEQKPITVDEIEGAEIAILRYIQKQEFPNTLMRLKRKQDLPKNDPLVNLKPYLGKGGLMRVMGRLSESAEPYNARHPIILPSKHHVVKLLIEKAHKEVGHMGKSSTVTALRQRYWILHAGQTVKNVLRKCLVCRKNLGKPSSQLMADLPKERVTAELPPFSNIGIDSFGPFMVVRGRSRVKRYGLIITCLASRAVHIEVMHSLTTDSFIQAFTRFRCRRGNIKVIISDNGTNFVGAKRELRLEIDKWNKKHLEKWLQQEQITWKFNPPSASHFGGVWEREIRSIRQVLGALLREQPIKMDDELLNTLFHQVENILNSRPLTEISNDSNDLVPLTPNHLLLLRGEPLLPIGECKKEDLYLRKRWKQSQYLADIFWKRWRKEYLPRLQERQKWNQEKPPHQEGDLVMIVDTEFLPRNQWAIGRIVKTYPDKNGRVRVVDVKMARTKGKKGETVMTRPIAKIILLKTCVELQGRI